LTAASPRPFVDTNVLLYLLSGEEAKADKAEALLAGRITISVQVLNEFANVARRRLGLEWRELVEVLRDIRSFSQVLPITEETHDRGLALAERYRLSLYDSMIVASALVAGCSVLYSEDMHNGLRIERSLTIRNPFFL
jgi:predicted nucleic acid-binding protein